MQYVYLARQAAGQWGHAHAKPRWLPLETCFTPHDLQLIGKVLTRRYPALQATLRAQAGDQLLDRRLLRTWTSGSDDARDAHPSVHLEHGRDLALGAVLHLCCHAEGLRRGHVGLENVLAHVDHDAVPLSDDVVDRAVEHVAGPLDGHVELGLQHLERRVRRSRREHGGLHGPHAGGDHLHRAPVRRILVDGGLGQEESHATDALATDRAGADDLLEGLHDAVAHGAEVARAERGVHEDVAAYVAVAITGSDRPDAARVARVPALRGEHVVELPELRGVRGVRALQRGDQVVAQRHSMEPEAVELVGALAQAAGAGLGQVGDPGSYELLPSLGLDGLSEGHPRRLVADLDAGKLAEALDRHLQVKLAGCEHGRLLGLLVELHHHARVDASEGLQGRLELLEVARARRAHCGRHHRRHCKRERHEHVDVRLRRLQRCPVGGHERRGLDEVAGDARDQHDVADGCFLHVANGRGPGDEVLALDLNVPPASTFLFA
mmetsp:Transcript_13210/g.49003  ORF Transcript_13210/g.49003 Transcript_13210/m.49003 type:complete len:493 (+) Transcript_13210:127-1605(+)